LPGATELIAFFAGLIVVWFLLQMSRPVTLVAVRPMDQSTTRMAVRTASSDMLQISENARGCWGPHLPPAPRPPTHTSDRQSKCEAPGGGVTAYRTYSHNYLFHISGRN